MNRKKGWVYEFPVFWEEMDCKKMQQCLDDGESVETWHETSGRTALHHVAQWNKNPKLIKKLVDAGARLDSGNLRGTTPLHSAALNAIAPEAMITALLDLGADATNTTLAGDTSYDWAKKNSNLKDKKVLERLGKACGQL